jgi:hypothetical protein
MKNEHKINKGIHRKIMMDMGVYNVHKQKVYKSKKEYTRKQKFKNCLFD